MKHFELNKYLRNNPLLKESTNENLSILDDETPIEEKEQKIDEVSPYIPPGTTPMELLQVFLIIIGGFITHGLVGVGRDIIKEFIQKIKSMIHVYKSGKELTPEKVNQIVDEFKQKIANSNIPVGQKAYITGKINKLIKADPKSKTAVVTAKDDLERAGNKFIKEAQLDPVNQELKNKYIEDYMTLLISPEAPDYDDEIADVDDIEAHAQEFGYEDTLRTMDKRFSSEFDGRGIPHGGFDPLQGKVVGNYDRTTGTYRREPVITKKGKMHKYDVDFLKKKIKSNLGLDQ